MITSIRLIGFIIVMAGGFSVIITSVITKISLKLHAKAMSDTVSSDGRQLMEWIDLYRTLLIIGLLSITVGIPFRWSNTVTIVYIATLYIFGGALLGIAYLEIVLLKDIFQVSIFRQLRGLATKNKTNNIGILAVPIVAAPLLQDEPITVILLVIFLVVGFIYFAIWMARKRQAIIDIKPRDKSKPLD